MAAQTMHPVRMRPHHGAAAQVHNPRTRLPYAVEARHLEVAESQEGGDGGKHRGQAQVVEVGDAVAKGHTGQDKSAVLPQACLGPRDARPLASPSWRRF